MGVGLLKALLVFGLWSISSAKRMASISESPGFFSSLAQIPGKSGKGKRRIYDLDGKDVNRKSVFHAYAVLKVLNASSNEESFIRIDMKSMMAVERSVGLPKQVQDSFRMFEADGNSGMCASSTRGRPLQSEEFRIRAGAEGEHLTPQTTMTFFDRLFQSLQEKGKNFLSGWHAKTFNCQHFLMHVLMALGENRIALTRLYHSALFQNTKLLLPGEGADFYSTVASGFKKEKDIAMVIAIYESLEPLRKVVQPDLKAPAQKALEKLLQASLDPYPQRTLEKARAQRICNNDERITGIEIYWKPSAAGAAVTTYDARKENNTRRYEAIKSLEMDFAT